TLGGLFGPARRPRRSDLRGGVHSREGAPARARSRRGKSPRQIPSLCHRSPAPVPSRWPAQDPTSEKVVSQVTAAAWSLLVQRGASPSTQGGTLMSQIHVVVVSPEEAY